MSRSRRPNPTVRPRLLALESRHCPSCVVTQSGDLLSIVGDAADNRIDIVQSAGTNYQVTCDGAPARTFSGVQRFAVDTGAGNDELTAFLPFVEQLTAFRALLGAGDDRAIIAIRNPESGLTPQATSLEILGERGNDNLSVTVGDQAAPQRDRFGGDLAIRLNGAAGSDNAIIVNFRLAETGTLREAIDLGDNDDSGIIINFDVAAPGSVQSSITGGAGSDSMIQDVNDCSGDWALSSNGGAGSDSMIQDANECTGDWALSMEGGAGSDSMVQDANECSGDWALSSNGGAGSDFMVQDANDFTGDWVASISGQDGNDTIAAQVGFNPQPDPPGTPLSRELHLSVDGGADNDVIHATVDFGGQPFARSEIQILGRSGNDLIDLSIVVDSPDLLTAIVDGGAGFDIATVSSFVRPLNCEIVRTI